MMHSNLATVRCYLLVAIVLAVMAGCGESRGLVPVKGRVTFSGGPPPKPGRLSFGPMSAADGFVQRPGHASFDADGNFAATSYQEGDGLTPGKYRVTVMCVERDPSPVPGGLEAVTYVAPGYKGQEFAVAIGNRTIDLNIDVPLKKRK